MPVKVDATLEGMAGYSWTIEKKQPSWVALSVAILFLLVGLLNSLNFFGIGNQGDPIIKFHAQIDKVSPNSYQTIKKKIPDGLQIDNVELEIYTRLHKHNYPEDFTRYYLFKLPFDLAPGILLILAYYQQMFSSKSQSQKLRKITDYGFIFSILMIFYTIFNYFFSSIIYTEILQKYPFLTVKNPIFFESQLSSIAIVLVVFSAYLFFQSRKAIHGQSISDVDSIEVKIL